MNDVLANPLRAASVNIIGTQHALEAARSAGVDRFVYASTVWVYGNGRSEASVDEETPPSPPSHPYTATKLAGEMLVHSYGDLYGVGTTTVRLGIPFGPRSRDAAVVAAFVHRASSRKALKVAGDTWSSVSERDGSRPITVAVPAEEMCACSIWKSPARQRLKRGVFKGIVDLHAAINRYLAETNDDPKPFTWTADPDAIIEKVRRGKQALEST